MSYARWLDCDVYVFLNCAGHISIHSRIDSTLDRDCTTTDGAVTWLAHMATLGHDIGEAIEGLKEEQPENDAWMSKVADGMCPSCENGSGRCHNCEGFEQYGHPTPCTSNCSGKCWECHGSGRKHPSQQVAS